MKKKLPAAQKLPSGTRRCQVMVDGKRISVATATPGEAQAKAVALKNGLLEQNVKRSRFSNNFIEKRLRFAL